MAMSALIIPRSLVLVKNLTLYLNVLELFMGISDSFL